jgi:hypothetical protein
MIGMVNFPTRITSTSSSAIDNIFVDKRSTYSIKPYINGLSDHNAQLLILNDVDQPTSDSKPLYIRNFNKFAIAEFQSLLSEELWEDVFDNTDVNIMFKNFLNKYLRFYNASFLKKNISKSTLSRSGWITNGIIISCKRKKELYVLSKITNNCNLKLYYKKYCSLLTKVIRHAKKLYFNNIIHRSKNKMKTIWKIINSESRVSHQDTSSIMLKLNGSVIDNHHKIANIFNNYFLSVDDASLGNMNNVVCSTMDNPISYLFKYYNKPFAKINWQYVSTHEIKSIIKSLEPKNSFGYDEISNRVIKLSLPFITSPLTYICNAALKSGVFPDRLKYAIVKPIHKKDSKMDIANYRPISILTSFSKIFERIIYNRLHAHFEINNILAREQFGFRMRHSTEQAAFSLINCILTAINSNRERWRRASRLYQLRV